MKLLSELFDQSISMQEMVEVFMSHDEPDQFWLGHVFGYSDQVFGLSLYNKQGEFNGLLWDRLEAVSSVSFYTKYSRAYKPLQLKRGETAALAEWQKEISFTSVLERIKARKEICSLEIGESFNIIGHISSLSYEELIISTIGSLGEKDGLSWYRISDVSAIRIKSLELETAHKLWLETQQ